MQYAQRFAPTGQKSLTNIFLPMFGSYGAGFLNRFLAP